MPRFFFDLDGTLIDSGKRLYSLFQFLVPQSKLTYEEYWDLKRHKIGHKQILAQHFGYADDAFGIFEKRWMDLIETMEYLDKDTVYPGVAETLQRLKKNHELYLVTARQSIKNTHAQLDKLGLSRFFDGIFVTEHKRSKEELLKQHFTPCPSDCMIGDTGKDIQTGKSLKMKTVAVTNGFLAGEVLKEYSPDKMAVNIAEGLKDA